MFYKEISDLNKVNKFSKLLFSSSMKENEPNIKKIVLLNKKIRKLLLT